MLLIFLVDWKEVMPVHGSYIYLHSIIRVKIRCTADPYLDPSGTFPFAEDVRHLSGKPKMGIGLVGGLLLIRVH